LAIVCGQVAQAMAGTEAWVERAVVAQAVSQAVRRVVSRWVAPMVRHVACAVVAEVVRGIVAWVISATDCGTMAEAVAVMVTQMKTGRLVQASGSAQGSDRVRVGIWIMSNAVWPYRRRAPCHSLV